MYKFLIFLQELNDAAESLLKLSVFLLLWFTVTFFLYGKLQRLLLGRWCGCGIWWQQHSSLQLPQEVYLPSPSDQSLWQRDLAHNLTHVRERFISKWEDDYERLRTLELFNDLPIKTPFRTLDPANYRGATVMGVPNCPGWSYGGESGNVPNSPGRSYGGAGRGVRNSLGWPYGSGQNTSLDNKDKYQRQRWGNTF